MSVAGGANPKADLSTAEAREKDYQAFCETLDLIDLVRDCVLCPDGLEFVNLCPCDERASKIKMLDDFEKEIKSKKKLITENLVEAQAKEDICLGHFQAAQWAKLMLDMLHKALKAVSDNSEALSALKKSESAAKLRVTFENLRRLMIDNGFFDMPEAEEMPDEDDDSRPRNILSQIGAGLFYYRKIKAKDEVLALLEDLEELEKVHVNAKKTVEEQGKELDPSISRGYIESQIKLVESFPVEELQPEAQKLIDDICPTDAHSERFLKARDFISNTCANMISTRKAFWRKFRSPGSTWSNNDHNLNGLNTTLDLLIAKANLFKKQWEEEYAPFYTPHDRSDPKRQRTEE